LPAISIAASTDHGRVRRKNEDAFAADPVLGLAVVADGMGGHPAGDVASRMAAQTVRAWRSSLPSLPSFLPPRPGSRSPMGAGMAEAVLRADALVRQAGLADPTYAQMGTTLTSLLVDPTAARAVVAHVGDSRAYVYDEPRLRQLTRDHSWVQQQIERGALDPSEARGHPWGHVLVQALGVGESIEPDVIELETRAGQVYLLCTDGLTNMLPDVAIERVLEDTLPRGLDAAARALVDAANDRGGADNITAVLVGI
jgi:protein phosphatase